MKNHMIIIVLLLSFSVSSWADSERAVLFSGAFEGTASQRKPWLSGSWEIVREGDATYLELGEDFKAKKGPDVKLFLSPVPADQITAKNATEQAVFIKLLDKFKGQSKIQIPLNANEIPTFKSVVFYCEKYSKLWGTSSISQ